MSYTAKNIQIFTAAFSGCLGGMGVSDRVITSSDPASYAGIASVAGAFTQAIDTAWGDSREASQLDLEALQSICEAYWQNRSPLATTDNLNPANHARAALAIIALLTAGEGYYSTQGLTPPPIPGSGGFTPAYLQATGADQVIAAEKAVLFSSVSLQQGISCSYEEGEGSTITFDAAGKYLVTYGLGVIYDDSAPTPRLGAGFGGGAYTQTIVTATDAPGLGLLFLNRTFLWDTAVNGLEFLIYNLDNVNSVDLNGGNGGVDGPAAFISITRIA